ncbi:MAG: hypothetical protein AAB316_00755, partial [Bacteroidota bacterium]
MKKEKNKTFEAMRKKLPTGFSRIVAERLAQYDPPIIVTPRAVQYVANGETRNEHIEKELLKLLKEGKPKSSFEVEVEKTLTE